MRAFKIGRTHKDIKLIATTSTPLVVAIQFIINKIKMTIEYLLLFYVVMAIVLLAFNQK